MKLRGPMFQWGYAWHCANYKNPRLPIRVVRFIGMYLGFIP